MKDQDQNQTIVTINDHQLLNDLLRPVFIEFGLTNILAFVDAKEGLEYILRNQPALVVIDLMLPLRKTLKGEPVLHDHPYVLIDNQTTLRAVRRIRLRAPGTKIIILSGERHPNTFLMGFEAGAHGIASKLDGLDAFRGVFWRVLKGESRVTSGRVKRILTEYSGFPRLQLSPIEIKILELTQEGMESPQIGKVLGYAPKTIRNIVSQINEKLGTTNRLQSLEIAIEMGLVGWRAGEEES